MKEYLEKLRSLVNLKSKSEIAYRLGIKDSRTIDVWFTNKRIPSKHLDNIVEIYNNPDKE